MKVTGKQSLAGRDVVVVEAKTATDGPNASTSIDATAYYDPQARLIVALHTLTNTVVKVTGMTSTSTADLTLNE